MRIRFAELTLDTEARRLSRQDGTEIRLSTKAFDLLRLLVERRPNVIDKDALHAQLWPRTFVVDANLTVLVAELRRALADNAREPRFIRTVHTLGYAFCADAVEVVPSAPGDGHSRCWLLWHERAIVLAKGENIIGRDPGCAVWLDVSGVSRSHARIDVKQDGDVVRLEDLGSKNGTFVDGAPIRGAVQVRNGSVIQVGGVELTVRIWSRGSSPETERIARNRD